MILDLDDLPENLTSLVLNESAEGASTLEMEFAGFLPTMEWGGTTEPNSGVWLGYHTPVSLRRNGNTVFHGKVTSYSHSNDAGRRSTLVTVTDALWLLDHIPFSAQVSEIIENAREGRVQDTSPDVRGAANVYMQTWESVAASLHVDAPGWTTGGTISLDVSLANYSLGAVLTREKVITAWGVLTRMHQANPDALIHMDPTGIIRVVSISRAPLLTLDADKIPILSATEISPLYENAVTAVAVVVTAQWTEEHANEEEAEEKFASAYAVYPENADLTQAGIKIFTATANNAANVQKQLKYMYGQACAYYRAVNTLQWGGSITVPIASLQSSPLMSRIMLPGTGAANHWGAMGAVVTAVTWDFLAGTATLTLGMQIQDPEISTLEFEDADVPGKEDAGYVPQEQYYSDDDDFGPGWESPPESSYDGPWWTWATRRGHTEESETEDTNIGTEDGDGEKTDTDNKKTDDKKPPVNTDNQKPDPGPGPGPTPTPGTKTDKTPPHKSTDVTPPPGPYKSTDVTPPPVDTDDTPPPVNTDNTPTPGPGGGTETPTPGPGGGTGGGGGGTNKPGGGTGGACNCESRLSAIEERLDLIEARLNAIDGKGDDDGGGGGGGGGGKGTGDSGALAGLRADLEKLQKTVEENGKAPECNCAANILAAQQAVLNAVQSNKISASGQLTVNVETTATGTIVANVIWSVNPDKATASIGYPDGGYS